MGRDKATLPFGVAERMLQRVARLVGEVVPAERIVCAAAPGQPLPDVPAGVRISIDSQPRCGPLAGLAAGLTALAGEIDAAYVTGCDVPLLVPAFVEKMFTLLGDYQIAAPHDGERFHPLAAVYRTGVLPIVQSRLASSDWSLLSLLDRCRTRRVPVDELRGVDPELASLANCNSPEDYRQALARTGHDPPLDV